MDESLMRDLRALVDKQALLELVYRYARGIDRRDEALFLSCFHPDAYQDQGYYKGSPQGLLEQLRSRVMSPDFAGPLQRAITNASFEIQGDIAFGECYCQTWTVMKNGEMVTGFCRYVDRFERRDGVWKIAYRRTVMDYLQPGWKPADFIESRRDRSDPSYDRSTVTPDSR